MRKTQETETRQSAKPLKKIRSQAGESLAETLVALLVAALALVILASMIDGSSVAIRKSREKLKTYYETNNAQIVGMKTDGEGIKTVTIAGGSGAEGFSQTQNVKLYKNGTFENRKVYAYKVP